MKKTTTILEISDQKARKFLLRSEAYCRAILPKYIGFDKVLTNIHNLLKNNSLESMGALKGCKNFVVNHTILDNKDGRYAWRPIVLIHPALYVELVHLITDRKNWDELKERFEYLNKNSRISCLSIPIFQIKQNRKHKRSGEVAMIKHWWQEIEQKSIQLSLNYEHVFHTDITDCYGSIYTHSIAWALHSKSKAKNKRSCNNLLGNRIDRLLMCMNEGQTNGIPQGPILSDLIAELVLCYADKKIGHRAKKESIEDYKILRYRDDYRIFVNSPSQGEQLLKIISEVMYSLGFKLNPNKTISSSDVITSVVKNDKHHWNMSIQRRHNLQKHLMLIRDLSKSYPNSGSLAKALMSFDRKLSKIQKPAKIKDARELISITIDIALHNPRTYASCSSILSKLLINLKNTDRKCVIDKIKQRFKKLPNTGYLELWLQRVTYPCTPRQRYDEKICKLVARETTQIWECGWIPDNKIKQTLENPKIVDRKKLKLLKETITPSEVDIFEY